MVPNKLAVEVPREGQKQKTKTKQNIKERIKFSKCVEMINLYVEAQPTPSRKNMIKFITRNIIIKLLKNRDKSKGNESKRNILLG